MQQHTPWPSKQKPPLGSPNDSRQKLSQNCGPVGHNVEGKQRFPFGNGTSPATIIKTTLEIQSNTVEKLKLKIYAFQRLFSYSTMQVFSLDLVSYLKPSQMKHK